VRGDSIQERSLVLLLLLALALALLNFFSFLDADLIRAGEARAAEIAREMVERGNFILPTLNHEITASTLTKPPLFHWFVAAVGAPFEWQNWAVRLPPTLFAMGTIWVLFLSGRLLLGLRAAVYAVVVLSTSILFMQNGSAARIDILFTLLIVSSLYFFWQAVSEAGRRNWIWGFYLCSALAVVAKGPVGLLLPFAIATFFLLVQDRPGLHRELFIKRGLLLFLAVALPWYLAMAFTAPQELVDNFLFGQLAHWWEGGSKAASGDGKSIFYYLPHILIGAFPWSLLLPGILFLTIREARENPRLKAILFWFLGGLILFSLGGKKASRYLLPLIPPLALLAGYYLDRIHHGLSRRHRRLLIAAGGVAVLGILFVFALLLAINIDSEAVLNALLQGRNRGGAQQLHEGWGLLQEVIGVATLLSLLSLLAALLALTGAIKGRITWLVVGSAAMIWTLVWPFSLGIKPQLDAAKSPRLVAEEIQSLLPVGEQLYGGGKAYKHAMRWYLQRNIILENREDIYRRIHSEKDAWVLLMTKKAPPEELLSSRPDNRQWRVDYYYVTFFPGR
jgi:4-amino-4-deoxy-L-arabinose transferase-like glycosyltransferase